MNQPLCDVCGKSIVESVGIHFDVHNQVNKLQHTWLVRTFYFCLNHAGSAEALECMGLELAKMAEGCFQADEKEERK